jgi:hypothetical protein
MPKHNVPGIGASTGMKGFPTFEPGAYGLEIQSCKVEESKDEPADIWKFNCIVKYGPPLPGGKSSVGQRYSNWITILRPEHPEATDEPDFRVDQLRSFADAAGVPITKDGINNELFAGREVEADLTKTQSKTNPERFFNNVRAVRPIGEEKPKKGTKGKATAAPKAKRGRKSASSIEDPVD